MHSTLPPLPDLLPISVFSRSGLKQLSTWIRDDLDIFVAREGPDILRSDDVLLLLETFSALHHAHDITAMDLRATGIHRAVQDIAGTATRWPGRLCDECDTLSSIWVAKFGPLRNLRPFLFGRGGRLEGIASVFDCSGEALLKRWAVTCPRNIHPRRSHRQGDLGFHPGAWWINSLFAYHAGIIGLESIEGGTTFDKHAVYALLLKDTVEIEATSLEQFTYRCYRNDKGRFRLTSATPRSREPVRVLRSHSMNSIWGPKAGVRYEGLFTVTGWSIQTAKSSDPVGEEWKIGDIIYEIKLERLDPVSITEVVKHPTAAELDDYSEYKRLRKAHRNKKQNELTTPLIKSDRPPAAKSSMPYQPLQLVAPPDSQPTGLSTRTHSALHKTLIKSTQFDEHSRIQFSTGLDMISPKNASEADRFIFTTLNRDRPAKATAEQDHAAGSTFNDPSKRTTTGTSNNSNNKIKNDTQTNIKDVAPWIDYEPGHSLPSADDLPGTSQQKMSFNSASASLKSRDSMKSKQKTISRGTQHSSHLFGATKRDYRKSIFARNRTSRTKLLDGTEDPKIYQDIDRSSDYISPSQASSLSGSSHQAQADDLPNTLETTRRNAFSFCSNGTEMFPRMPTRKAYRFSTILPESNEAYAAPFDITVSHLATSLPLSLEKLISQTSTAGLICSPVSPYACSHNTKGEEDRILEPHSKLRNVAEDGKGPAIMITFREPFWDSPQSRKSLREETNTVAPDVVM